MKFGDFCEIQPRVKLEKNQDYSFVPMEDVKADENLQVSQRFRTYTGGGAKFCEGDTIFARITPCLEHGKIALVRKLDTDCGFGSTEYFVFRPKLGVSTENYLFYLSKSAKITGPAIKSMTGSSGRQRARKEVIQEIGIKAPEISEQKKIGGALRAYDDLIENNRRRIVLLEEAARLLYREWFVHFRFPGSEHVKIVDGVPEGWEDKTCAQAVLINPKTEWDKDKPILSVPMAALSETGMIAKSSSFEVRTKSTGVRFKNGDTLLARITPCLENGKTGFVNFLGENEVACGSTEYIVLRKKMVSRYYIYLMAREEDFRNNAIKSMIGSTGRQRVQPSCFNKFKVPVPTAKIAEYFDEAVKPMFDQIGVLDKQNKHLIKARDLLLPRLMDGRLEI